MSGGPARPTRFADPAARNYLFAGLAAVLVVAAATLLRPGGGLAAAVLPAVVGAVGLVGRLTALPVVYPLMLGYLLVFPGVVPVVDYKADEFTQRTHFRLADLVLAAGVLVYFAAQYRLLGLADRAFPDDAPARKRGRVEDAPRRAGAAAGEVERMFAVLGACVVAGQLAWLLVSEFRVDLRGRPPLVLPEQFGLRRSVDTFVAAAETSRFLILAGLVGAVGGVAGLVFWYRRLTALTPAEARMVLLDTLWREHRRDLGRQEHWRAWAVNRRRRPSRQKRPQRARRRIRWASVFVTTAVLLGGAALLAVVIFVVLAFIVTRYQGR